MAIVESQEETYIYHQMKNDILSINQQHSDSIIAASLNAGITSEKSVTTFDVDKLYAQFEAFLEEKSGGKGAELSRIISFLVIGGSAAVLNLVCVGLFSHIIDPHRAYWLIISLATEIALLFNFVLNDRFTFHSFADNSRTWLQRCVRFHGPGSIGFVLTLVISSFAFKVGHPHLTPVTAQAIAIVIVTFVNFTLHRFWTFRPAKTTVETVG